MDKRPDPDETAQYRVTDRRWWAQENPEAAAADERKPTYIESLEAELRQRDTIVQETQAQYRRASAEFDQARQRIEREAARQAERDRRAFLARFLDLLDDLERANAAALLPGATAASLSEGITLVAQRFLTVLGEYGVTRVDAAQQAFDPARHDAVSIVEVEDDRDGQVVEVVKPGYCMGDDTLRPAQVVVGRRRPS